MYVQCVVCLFIYRTDPVQSIALCPTFIKPTDEENVHAMKALKLYNGMHKILVICEQILPNFIIEETELTMRKRLYMGSLEDVAIVLPIALTYLNT